MLAAVALRGETLRLSGNDAGTTADVGVAAYTNAVDALLAVGGQVGPDEWASPSACLGWDAAAVAGHVLCVVRWHHQWLDRAEAGDTSIPWPVEELEPRNRAALVDLEIDRGPDRLDAFRVAGHRYAERLPNSWGLPFSYPGGRLTVGVHAVLAAGEWHLHAWDLGRAIGIEHVADAAPIRATWVALGRRVEPHGDPWRALLRASGRTP